MAASPYPADFSSSSARRLVAVWFADLVGYSGLASRDEQAALQQVHDFQSACHEAAGAHGGRIVKFLGDGALAEFPSTEAAVRAALAVSEGFAERRKTSVRDAALRIGVHVGDVVTREDGDLYGDGVNTAARLQAEARPGQILVSGDVWRQLRSLRGLGFRPLGARDLRGIDHPIEVFAASRDTGSAAEGEGRVSHFLRDLKRRYVLRVGLTYLLAAWVVIQVSAAVSPALGLPGWTTGVLVVWAVLGLPIALVLAWAVEVSPDRVARTDLAGRPVDGRKSASADDAEPPFRDAPAAPAGARNLPARVTPFVGRDAELERIETLLSQAGCRLVTVTGAGGIGKTSLAIEAAHALAARFRDGAVFVPLAAQTAADAVLPLVAERLGLRLAPGLDARGQVMDFLRAKEVLVVLDNFEQLVEHAGVLASVLEQAPKVRAIVTSRERLNLKQETVVPLEGLEVDDAGEAAAIRLFVDTARRLDPAFALQDADRGVVAEICRRVDGIPLAIELAAHWTRGMSCADILAEVEKDYDFLSGKLHDVPERHRSLGAVFESAWRLLADDERAGLRRLAVFAGGFSREAAENIAGASYPILAALVDQSLLKRDQGGRYQMPDVLRQYARERLEADQAEAAWMAEKHGKYFLETLTRVPFGGGAPQIDAALAAVATELENIRDAWWWAVAQRRVADLSAGLEGLFEFFDARGRLREGEELLRTTVDHLEGGGSAPDPDRTALLGRIWIRQGVFLALTGRHEEAKRLSAEGLRVVGTGNLAGDAALALDNLGRIALAQGRYEEASRSYRESYDLATRRDDARLRGRALVGQGNVAYQVGDYAGAQALYRESVHLLREANDRSGLASSLCNIAILASTDGDHGQAKRLLQESLAISRNIGHPRGIVTALHNLGATAYLAGDHEEAERRLREGILLCRELGFRRHLAPFLNILGNVLRDTGDPAGALASYRESLDAAVELGEAPVVLETMVSCAGLLRSSDPRAARAAAAYVRDHPGAERQSREAATAIVTALEAEGREGNGKGAGTPRTLAAAVADLRLALDACVLPEPEVQPTTMGAEGIS